MADWAMCGRCGCNPDDRPEEPIYAALAEEGDATYTELCTDCFRALVGPAPLSVGDVIPCPIADGEIASGEAAGLLARYTLRGVGLVPMRDVYEPEELTDACGPHDTCWAAEIVAIAGEG